MGEQQKLAELVQLSKYYQTNGSSRLILSKIDLLVKSGDSIAITGPSGSGKTTLLNMLGLLDKPISGKVLFKGLDAQYLKPDELAGIRNQHIGFVFQLHYLLPQLTLAENIMVPVIPVKDPVIRKQASKRGMELFKMVGLSDKAVQRPGQLSVGECQRAAVVRALINSPELILADEPTGSLDHDTGEELGELLEDLTMKMDIGLVVVTHSADLARRMKTVYHLINGKLQIQ